MSIVSWPLPLKVPPRLKLKEFMLLAPALPSKHPSGCHPQLEQAGWDQGPGLGLLAETGCTCPCVGTKWAKLPAVHLSVDTLIYFSLFPKSLLHVPRQLSTKLV